MEIALLVLASIALFVNLTGILVMLFLLVQAIRDMHVIKTLTTLNTGKTAGIEKLALSTYTLLMQDMLGMTQGGRPGAPPSDWESMGVGRGEDGNFITEDGMHSAPSFDELMKKISQDPRYRVARPDDVDKLRQQFDEFNEQHGGDEGFGPDEGHVDGDEWKDSNGS
jgi:hypothetical protein